MTEQAETPKLVAVYVIVDGQRAFAGLHGDIPLAERFCTMLAERLMPDIPDFEYQLCEPASVDPDGIIKYAPCAAPVAYVPQLWV